MPHLVTCIHMTVLQHPKMYPSLLTTVTVPTGQYIPCSMFCSGPARSLYSLFFSQSYGFHGGFHFLNLTLFHLLSSSPTHDVENGCILSFLWMHNIPLPTHNTLICWWTLKLTPPHLAFANPAAVNGSAGFPDKLSFLFCIC